MRGYGGENFGRGAAGFANGPGLRSMLPGWEPGQRAEEEGRLKGGFAGHIKVDV